MAQSIKSIRAEIKRLEMKAKAEEEKARLKRKLFELKYRRPIRLIKGTGKALAAAGRSGERFAESLARKNDSRKMTKPKFKKLKKRSRPKQDFDDYGFVFDLGM